MKNLGPFFYKKKSTVSNRSLQDSQTHERIVEISVDVHTNTHLKIFKVSYCEEPRYLQLLDMAAVTLSVLQRLYSTLSWLGHSSDFTF